MKSQMLDHARRPARLRARQKTALSATGRDCVASHQKPKRFAVRGGALPGCFAWHRLPPTATETRIRRKDPKQDGIAKYALPLHKLTIQCPRNRRAIFAQSPCRGRNLSGPFQEQPRSGLSAQWPCPCIVPGICTDLNVPLSCPVRVHKMSMSSPQLVPPGLLFVQSFVRWFIGKSAFINAHLDCLSNPVKRALFHHTLLKYPRVGHSKRPLLLREWCFGLRRKCVRTFLAALCYRVSRAESVGLCPLAPDGRTTIACPCLRPQAIALVCALPFRAILSFAVRSCVRSMKRLSLGRSSPWLVRVAWPADQKLIIGDRNGVSHGNSSPSRNAIS